MRHSYMLKMLNMLNPGFGLRAWDPASNEPTGLLLPTRSRQGVAMIIAIVVLILFLIF